MNGNKLSLSVEETEIIRLVLQFLSSRKLYKSTRNLERESGVTNCSYSDDILFLRQLILDGEWDSIFTYVQPLEEREGFDAKTFRYLILKEKFMEILYFKSGIEGVSSSFSIEDMIKCLNQLEKNCPAKSDYTKLCWLLTVPDLYELPEYQGWNPESARWKCFSEIVELLKNVMSIHKKKPKSLPSLSQNRLVNLIGKGLCFESCVDYCHQRAMNAKADEGLLNICNNVLSGVSHENTGNFLSWLNSLPQESFTNPFEAASLEVDLKKSTRNVKHHLSIKRLQTETQNLSKSLSLSSRPSTASRIEEQTRPVEVPESLAGVKKVSNSYANFQFTKPNAGFKPIAPEPSNEKMGSRRDSLNEADQQLDDKHDNNKNEKDSKQVSPTANGVTDRIYNSHHNNARGNAQDTEPITVGGYDIPKKDDKLGSSKKEVRDSQDSLDQLKRHQENSVLKQLEEHERHQAELRRQLIETSNAPLKPDEALTHGTAGLEQPNVRHPSDGHSLPSDEHKTEDIGEHHDTTPRTHINKSNQENKLNHTNKRMQRESPVGKEVSPCFKDHNNHNYTDTKTPVTSTPLAKKKSIPEPLKLDNIGISHIKEPSIKESPPRNDNEMNQSNVNQADVSQIIGGQFPKTPLAKILPPGHWVALADGSGVLNTSTPKSSRQKMSNTPAPQESPVEEAETNREAIPYQQDPNYEDETGSDTPTARKGPKINGVRRTLTSNGPPMGRNKGTATPSEGVQEIKTTKQDRPNKAKSQDSPRDRISANQKQASTKKISREEAENVKPKTVGNTFVVDNGTVNQTYHKTTSHTPASAITLQQKEINKMLDKQHGYLKNNADAIRFSAIASLEDVQAIRAVAFHPSGELFAIGSNSKSLRVCSTTGLTTYKKMDREHSKEMIPPQPTILFKRNKHHKGSIYCAAWNSTGDMIATGSNDKTIKVLPFDAENCTQVGPELELNIHGGTVRDLAFATRGGGTSVLVSGGAGNGNIQISDCSTGNTIGQLKGHLGHIMSIFAAKDDIIVSGSNDNTVRLWDLRSQRCIDVIATGESCVVSVCANPAGTLLASGHEDGGCMIYDITAGRTLQFFKPHTLDCRSVRFSPDGHYLLTASYDTSIILLNMQYNLECNIPPYSVVAQHSDKVIQCRWHPQLMAFVSSSADKTAQLWTLDC